MSIFLYFGHCYITFVYIVLGHVYITYIWGHGTVLYYVCMGSPFAMLLCLVQFTSMCV